MQEGALRQATQLRRSMTGPLGPHSTQLPSVQIVNFVQLVTELKWFPCKVHCGIGMKGLLRGYCTPNQKLTCLSQNCQYLFEN